VTEDRTLDTRALDELRESVGGDAEFFSELVDEFLADAPRQLESLRDAAAAEDAETCRRAAHTLKGNARTFGAEKLASLCLEVETAAAAGDLDVARVRLDAIAEAWSEVGSELLALRGGSS
jgi:histidine phosphotransfer protein HptB